MRLRRIDDRGASAMIIEERSVDLAGDESLQASDDVLLAQALCGTSTDVVECRLVPAHPHDDDSIERGVGLAMASTKEPVSVGHTARCRNGTRPTELRKGRFRPDPRRIVAGDDHHFSGGVSADAERLSKRGNGC